ncbi:MAG: response regulator [Myxococcota bacterium]
MAKAKQRVLVVDDDHDCRLVLSALMARAGFSVDAVADGEMALNLMRTQPPDLVLLDAHLPRTDGWEVCRTIKDTPETTHTPVVMLTAFASGDARSRSLEAGADEFVAKPFRADALLELVEQLLTIRDAASQLDPGADAVVDAMNDRRGKG